MPTFSERLGFVKPRTVLQLDEMTPELRMSLWNFLAWLYDRYVHDWPKVAKNVATHFRKSDADAVSDVPNSAREWLKKYFFALTWNGAYDLMEFLGEDHERVTYRKDRYGHGELHEVRRVKFYAKVNYILERELSGYRFIEGQLAPISTTAEVAAVETALTASQRSGLAGAHEHLRTAISLLSKKPEPDYRNCIKEAISAVESIAKQISGNDSGTLGPALKALGDAADLHSALEGRFPQAIRVYQR